ncbi:MAG TPA: choice-of-anchor L domain-containing protein [Planctomycetota bacterium]|nr:choice-of-anchor L domain-containing protein [Planctomycetota bacterium]
MNLVRFSAAATAVTFLGLASPLMAQRQALAPGHNTNATAKVTDSLSTTDLTTLTPADLVTALIGPGVVASNIVYLGVPIAAGTFSGGTGIIGFESGIILSSGNIASVPGPNDLNNTSTDNGEPGDPDLEALIPFTGDRSVLEFDFECTGISTISFQYVFSSEEYNEYVNSSFNDVFGFFLNGVNIALLPGTSNPVAINNVNGGNPFTGVGPNSTEYINNMCGAGGLPPFPCAGNVDTEMDGLTVVFTATATILPGINHIKLGIADVADRVWDSNVFIRGQSFACATPGPFFDPPSPCGATVPASVGVPVSYSVVAGAASGLPGNAVTLVAAGTPAGAMHTPALPLTVTGPSATAATVFSWTPTNADVGTHTIVYTATDQTGQFTTCSVDVVVAECYLFLGFTEGAVPLGPEPDDVVLVLPVVWYPVTMTSIPALFIPNDAALLNLTVASQVGMFNPQIFPTNPFQMSNGLRLTIGTGIQNYGFTSGIALTGDPVPALGSNYHFSFTIAGM